jgi:hypothetical protein
MYVTVRFGHNCGCGSDLYKGSIDQLDQRATHFWALLYHRAQYTCTKLYIVVLYLHIDLLRCARFCR